MGNYCLLFKAKMFPLITLIQPCTGDHSQYNKARIRSKMYKHRKEEVKLFKDNRLMYIEKSRGSTKKKKKINKPLQLKTNLSGSRNRWSIY